MTSGLLSSTVRLDRRARRLASTGVPFRRVLVLVEGLPVAQSDGSSTSSPHLGNVQIAKISTSTVRQWRADLLGSGRNLGEHGRQGLPAATGRADDRRRRPCHPAQPVPDPRGRRRARARTPSADRLPSVRTSRSGGASHDGRGVHASMSAMREELHALVDRLPEDRVQLVFAPVLETVSLVGAALLARRLRYPRPGALSGKSRWWRDVSGRHVDGQSGCLGSIGQSFVVRDE